MALSRTRRWRTGARIAGAGFSALVLVGTLTGLVIDDGRWPAALGLPAETADDSVAAAQLVEARPEVLVCPPGVHLPEGADVGDEQFAALPTGTETATAVARLPVLDSATTTGADLPAGVEFGPAQVGDPAADVVRFTVQPQPGQSFAAAGATASLTQAGDLRGLAVGACSAPAVEQWLLGGDTEVGATSVLAVTNPSSRAATVVLEVFGGTGPVPLGTRGAFVVAPGETVEIRLDAVAPEQRRLAVRVTASGARVVASLQTSRLAGLIPEGIDLITPGANPATALVVAPLISEGQGIDDPHAPALRLLAPNSDAVVQVQLLGAAGPVPVRGAFELQAGEVTDLPLGGVPAGAYVVLVTADQPVVAAGRWTRAGSLAPDSALVGTPLDSGWAPAGLRTATSDSAQVAVPQVGEATLVLAALGPVEDGEPGASEVVTDLPSGTGEVLIRGFSSSGEVSGILQLELTAGAVATLPAQELGSPVFVQVAPQAGAGIAWGVLLEASDGVSEQLALVSTLAPTATIPAMGQVLVQETFAR